MVDDATQTVEYRGTQIVAAANEALKAAGEAQGRRLGMVNLRTVRYYATIGLIDQPLKRGRDAIYNDGHLKGLVRARSLQAAGYSLDEIKSTDPRRFWVERPQLSNFPTAESISATSATNVSAGHSHLVADGVRIVVDSGSVVTSAQLGAIRQLLSTPTRSTRPATTKKDRTPTPTTPHPTRS